MFETQDFRAMLKKTLTMAISGYDLDGYDSEIIDEMQKIAISISSRIGPDIEASAPGGQTQDERNAETVIEEAAAIAVREQRRYIRMEDIYRAIAKYYCQVWPFCEEERAQSHDYT